MENQPQPHKSRRKNSLPVRIMVGPSPQLPPDSRAEQSTATTQATSVVPPMDTTEIVRIMRDFLATLKPEERPSEVFVKMAKAMRLKEDASLLTPLHIPPRSSTLAKTTTAQQISSATHTLTTLPLPEAARDENAPVTTSTATHAEEVEYIVDEVMEEAEWVATESEEWTGTEEDVGVDEVVGKVIDVAEKDMLAAGKNSDNLVCIDLNVEVEEGVGSKPDLNSVAEGETSVNDPEGETPVTDDEGETPVIGEAGVTIEKFAEGETPVESEELGSGGLQHIVILDEDPEGDETLVDERLIRRRTMQRSILDEVDEPTELEERRLAMERKRKGKHEMQVQPKKPKRTLTTKPIKKLVADVIKVPFAKGMSSQHADSEHKRMKSQNKRRSGSPRSCWNPWRRLMIRRGHKLIRKEEQVGNM